MVKKYTVFVLKFNPVGFTQHLASDPIVKETKITVTNQGWGGPKKKEWYSIGEWRKIKKGKKPIATGVFDLHLKRHREFAEIMKAEVLKSVNSLK
jgi:hypothetical protein